MPIVEYPFHTIAPGHPARPMLPIQIVNPETSLALNTWAQIDTGADECALPAIFAETLGHDLRAGTEKVVATGNGESVSYAHSTRIHVFGITDVSSGEQKIDVSNIVYTVPDTPIDFMPNLSSILIGVRNFLSCFVLIIDYPRRTFSLRMSP